MPETFERALYPLEQERGYDCSGDLWTPGYFRFTLGPDDPGTLIASAESWETINALTPEDLPEPSIADALASLKRRRWTRVTRSCRSLCSRPISSSSRPPGASRSTRAPRAAATRFAPSIAGYHWFTDWGRDTMISLEG
jgi:glycogen debranching enzyme